MKKVFVAIICLSIAIFVFSLIMIFKPDSKVTITFMDGTSTIEERTVAKGEVIHLPTPVKENYVFDGWYNQQKKLGSSAWFDKNTTLTASWKEAPPQMTITYDTNGGKKIDPTQVNCDEPLKLPIPYRQDYEFKYWIDSKNNIITNSSKLACADITLIAQWKGNGSSNYDINKSSYTSLNLESALTAAGLEKKFTSHTPNSDAITIYLFYGKGCKHCHNFLSFLSSITNAYGKYFNLEAYEVWGNQKNSKLMDEIAAYRGEKVTGVPYIIIGKQSYKGYSEKYNESIKKAITDSYNTQVDKRYDILNEMNIR